MTDSIRPLGETYRLLPGHRTDGSERPFRLTNRGEQFTRALDRFALADEGSYFIAHNATNDASTTLAGHAAPVLADADATLTKPFIHLQHSGASADVRVYLDFIEIEVVTAGANGTQACWAAQLDYLRGITTPGTALTKVNPNMASDTTSVLAVTGGAIVVPVETASVRHLAHGTIRPSIEIAGDIKMFVFGGAPEVIGTQAGQAAAAIRTSVINLPPVILGPGGQFLLALHSQASQTVAGVYKVRMGWTER